MFPYLPYNDKILNQLRNSAAVDSDVADVGVADVGVAVGVGFGVAVPVAVAVAVINQQKIVVSWHDLVGHLKSTKKIKFAPGWAAKPGPYPPLSHSGAHKKAPKH